MQRGAHCEKVRDNAASFRSLDKLLSEEKGEKGDEKDEIAEPDGEDEEQTARDARVMGPREAVGDTGLPLMVCGPCYWAWRENRRRLMGDDPCDVCALVVDGRCANPGKLFRLLGETVTLDHFHGRVALPVRFQSEPSAASLVISIGSEEFNFCRPCCTLRARTLERVFRREDNALPHGRLYFQLLVSDRVATVVTSCVTDLDASLIRECYMKVVKARSPFLSESAVIKQCHNVWDVEGPVPKEFEVALCTFSEGLVFSGGLNNRCADVVVGLAPRHLIDRLTDMCCTSHDSLEILDSPSRLGCLNWSVRPQNGDLWKLLFPFFVPLCVMEIESPPHDPKFPLHRHFAFDMEEYFASEVWKTTLNLAARMETADHLEGLEGKLIEWAPNSAYLSKTCLQGAANQEDTAELKHWLLGVLKKQLSALSSNPGAAKNFIPSGITRILVNSLK